MSSPSACTVGLPESATPVLEAAIASPRNLWAYEGEENLFRLAAHLLVSLAKAHAYSDGNKRIASPHHRPD